MKNRQLGRQTPQQITPILSEVPRNFATILYAQKELPEVGRESVRRTANSDLGRFFADRQGF